MNMQNNKNMFVFLCHSFAILLAAFFASHAFSQTQETPSLSTETSLHEQNNFSSSHVEDEVELDINAVLKKIKELRLAQSTAWKRLLWIPEGRNNTIIDTENFLLASPNNWSPERELEATVQEFFQPFVPKEKTATHPLCRYPARKIFLEKHIGKIKEWQKITCTEFETWFEYHKSEQVFLVFSSYYVNNPASMFGHTFLRLRRHKSDKLSNSSLLDFGVSFAAYPTTTIPLLYAPLGLFGGFFGRFDLLSYHMKVQEYNNAEARDLWEYELGFTPEETSFLLCVLWEVGPHAINYYYFDENCAFALLLLFEIIRPELSLLKNFVYWITPVDSVRVTYETPGLVKNYTFRPSNQKVWYAWWDTLNQQEKKVLIRIIQEQKLEKNLESLPTTSQARVCDALFAYIDYAERLAGTKEPERYKNLRQELLLKRANIDEIVQHPQVSIPIAESPHLSHPSGKITLGLNTYKNIHGILQVRPALHDIFEPSLGLSRNFSIDFFKLNAIFGKNKTQALSFFNKKSNVFFEVEKFSAFKVLSFSPFSEIEKNLSWGIDVGFINARQFYGEPTRKNNLFVEGHVGISFLLASNITFYTLPLAKFSLTSLALKNDAYYLDFGTHTGILWDFSPTTRLANVNTFTFLLHEQKWSQISELNIAQRLSSHKELSLSLRIKNQKLASINLLGGFYFE